MKRWLLRLGLAAVTFTLGYGVYFLTTTIRAYNHTVRTYNQKSLEALPYCQVAKNAEMYHNNEILVTARIFVAETTVYVYEDCDPVEALAAGVVINESSPGIGPGYVDKLLLSNNDPDTQTAQALIKGRFDAHASTGCWAPKFRIHAEKIELLSSLTDFKPPQTEGPALRLKH